MAGHTQVLNEFVEVIVPLLVTTVEIFLYFGWNQEFIPNLSALPLSDFVASGLAKIFYVLLEVCTAFAFAYIIDHTTTIDTGSVLTWILNE